MKSIFCFYHFNQNVHRICYSRNLDCINLNINYNKIIMYACIYLQNPIFTGSSLKAGLTPVASPNIPYTPYTFKGFPIFLYSPNVAPSALYFWNRHQIKT